MCFLCFSSHLGGLWISIKLYLASSRVEVSLVRFHKLTRWAVKDCLLLFQKASTKTLLYFMATGHTVAPRSKAPRLNMTQYSLLTQVPSGKIRRGVVSAACTCCFILSATTTLSLTCAGPRKLRAAVSACLFNANLVCRLQKLPLAQQLSFQSYSIASDI